jgi:hypothetical protein
MPTEDFGLNRGRKVVLFGLAVLLGVGGKMAWDVATTAAAPEPVVAPAVEAPKPPAPRPVKRGKPKRTSARRAVPEAAPALTPVAAPAVAAPEPEPEPMPMPMPAPPLVSTEPEPQAALVLDDGNGEAIARAIQSAKRGAVQQCFERELKSNPKLAGTVVVELELTPPQQVTSVTVSDDLERPAFTQCVRAAMQGLSFSGLNEELSVRVPYALSARGK